METSSNSDKPEYQHFVPQFLLRNFAKKYQPHKDPSRQAGRPRRKNRDKIYSGESVVNHVNLTKDVLVVDITKVKRVLGMNLMYQDMSQATAKQRHRIEELFGKLESKLAPIFQKIVKAWESRESGISLLRGERNDIRKFLFLLKYRGSHFHQRYSGGTVEEYDSDDKSLLRDYMRKKGIQRPVDVWFQGIEAIAECDMDSDAEWLGKIQELMYPEDARWFINHTQSSCMAFCTPSNVDEEFLLTENSYNVYEGINCLAGPWVNFHDFAPVSPKLMIVLRSAILPVPEEDTNPEVRKWRQFCYRTAVDMMFGEGIKSELADLPITKARNNYTRIDNDQLVLVNEGSTRTKDDKFAFKFFPLEAMHVNKINSFLLEHATSSIVFASRRAFTRTLEWYMTDRSKVWKSIVGTVNDKRLKVAKLEKLAALLKSLGSGSSPFWEDPFGPLTESSQGIVLTGLGPNMSLLSEFFKIMDTTVAEMDKACAGEQEPSAAPPTPFLELYTLLGNPQNSVELVSRVFNPLTHETVGGTLHDRMYNIQQAQRMLTLRVKLDTWFTELGLAEDMRRFGRQKLLDMYMRLPPVRVWLYTKQLRIMFASGEILLSGHEPSHPEFEVLGSCDQPEDVIGAGAYLKLPAFMFHVTRLC